MPRLPGKTTLQRATGPAIRTVVMQGRCTGRLQAAQLGWISHDQTLTGSERLLPSLVVLDDVLDRGMLYWTGQLVISSFIPQASSPLPLSCATSSLALKVRNGGLPRFVREQLVETPHCERLQGMIDG